MYSRCSNHATTCSYFIKPFLYPWSRCFWICEYSARGRYLFYHIIVGFLSRGCGCFVRPSNDLFINLNISMFAAAKRKLGPSSLISNVNSIQSAARRACKPVQRRFASSSSPPTRTVPPSKNIPRKSTWTTSGALMLAGFTGVSVYVGTTQFPGLWDSAAGSIGKFSKGTPRYASLRDMQTVRLLVRGTEQA